MFGFSGESGLMPESDRLAEIRRRDSEVIARMRPRVVPTTSDSIIRDYEGWRESILFDAEHDRRELLAVVTRLEAQVAAVEFIHTECPRSNWIMAGEFCKGCGEKWPCETKQAMDNVLVIDNYIKGEGNE